MPWQANGYFDGDEGGLGNLVDLDRDGRAELLYLHVQGYDRGEAEATSISRYEIRDGHLTRIAGPFAGEMFPIIRPVGAQIRSEPDLMNAIGPGARRYTITSVIAGKKENCGVQVTLRRLPGGEVAVDAAAAEAQAATCQDRLVLPDGTTVSMPEILVVDGHDGREAAIGDVGRLIAKMKASRMAVQFAGRVCEDGCRPFLLWASEAPR